MERKDINSILEMNKLLVLKKNDHEYCFFIRKIIESKINSVITNKSKPNLLFWVLGFIFAGRSVLSS
jgi:hypothetical protein